MSKSKKQLNQKTRIYNKKVQKLTSIKDTKAILKKGTVLKYDKTVLPLVDSASKRLAFHNTGTIYLI